jgi:SAM-dependent methyltransferase
MKKLSHTNAKASHYDQAALLYDAFNEKNSAPVNQLLAQILAQYRVNTVLDLTCGTGSQLFWLLKHGYDVVGADINAHMLHVAKAKAKKQKLAVKLIQGDMRKLKVGQFDAVITIFNAVGHLTQSAFATAMQNIHANLNERGLYIFDIFNLDYLLTGDNITKLTIDWQKKLGTIITRAIQYSTITHDGILASYDIFQRQTDRGKKSVATASQTLQVYSAKQLQAMLQDNGFKVLRQCGIDGSRFSARNSERILTIARKHYTQSE